MKNRKIVNLAVLTILLLCFSLSSFAGNKLPKWANTPYAILKYELEQSGFNTNGMSVMTVIPSETLNMILPSLRKDLKIKQDVANMESSAVGDVLTTLLKLKYGKKSNVKNDFLSVQYSVSSSDFSDYLGKYADSKFADEAKARMTCLKEKEMLEEANDDGTRISYEAFLAFSAGQPDCSYEGCEELSKANHLQREAISQWYKLIDSSDGSDPVIFRGYADYIQKYGDVSVFKDVAQDSLDWNLDKYDWNIAKETNTLDS